MARFSALYRRQPQGRWSQRWNVDSKGVKTTTTTGEDANGQPVTSVVVTDSSGSVISQTGPDIGQDGKVIGSTPAPATSETPSPSSEANPAPTTGSESSDLTGTSPANNDVVAPGGAAETNTKPGNIIEPAEQEQQQSESGMSSGAIAGLVIGLLVLLVLIAFVARRLMIRRRQRRAKARFSVWAPSAAKEAMPRGLNSPGEFGGSQDDPLFTSPAPAAVSSRNPAPPMIQAPETFNNSYNANAMGAASPSSMSEMHEANVSITRNAEGFFVPIASPRQGDLRIGANAADDSAANTPAFFHTNARPRSPTGGDGDTSMSGRPDVVPAVSAEGRPMSTDRYRLPVGSVYTEENSMPVDGNSPLEDGKRDSYISCVLDRAAILEAVNKAPPAPQVHSRVYLTDEPITDEDDGMEEKDVNASGIGGMLGLKHFLSAGFDRARSAGSDSGAEDDSFTMNERIETSSKPETNAPPLSPLLSPNRARFPSFQSTASQMATHSSASTLSVSGAGQDGVGRPPSNASVLSRQAIAFESAPMPRATLRVINRHSREPRSLE